MISFPRVFENWLMKIQNKMFFRKSPSPFRFSSVAFSVSFHRPSIPSPSLALLTARPALALRTLALRDPDLTLCPPPIHATRQQWQQSTSHRPTMLGLSSIRHSVARSSAPSSLGRALSTSESLKVSSATTSPAAQTEERIKYFKIYRWDPDHRQKPVRIPLLRGGPRLGTWR